MTSVSCAFAQEYLFKVLLNKGDNSLVHNGGQEPLKIGAPLYSGDVLKTVGNVYVGLVHKSGRTLELTSPNSYSVEELEKLVLKKNNSVLAKYGQYVLNKMSDEGASGQNLNVTGAVERGSAEMIPVYLPYSNELFGSEAIVQWKEQRGVNEYEVVLKNMFDEEIKRVDVKGHSIAVDFAKEPFASERLIIVTVKAKDDEQLASNDYGIKKMTEKEYSKVKKEFESIQHISEGSTLENLLIASFFEEKNLLIDAIARYQKAITEHPEMGDFQLLYEDFLFRNGLK